MFARARRRGQRVAAHAVRCPTCTCACGKIPPCSVMSLVEFVPVRAVVLRTCCSRSCCPRAGSRSCSLLRRERVRVLEAEHAVVDVVRDRVVFDQVAPSTPGSSTPTPHGATSVDGLAGTSRLLFSVTRFSLKIVHRAMFVDVNHDVRRVAGLCASHLPFAAAARRRGFPRSARCPARVVRGRSIFRSPDGRRSSTPSSRPRCFRSSLWRCALCIPSRRRGRCPSR